MLSFISTSCISVSFAVPLHRSLEFQICIARTQCILLTLFSGTLYCYIAANTSSLCIKILQKMLNDMFTVKLKMEYKFSAHFHVWNGLVGFFFHSRLSSICILHGLVGLSWFECGGHFVQVDVLGVFLQEHAGSPLECLHVCVITYLPRAHIWSHSGWFLKVCMQKV